MTYAESVAHLLALTPELAPAEPGSAPRRFDLHGMRTLCAALGGPERRVPSILIAGTNGKGSTAATLASILTAAGYRTGLYTSPHLERVNERMQIARPVMPSEYGALTQHAGDGKLRLQPIADADFARLYTAVDETCERLLGTGAVRTGPSFFERLTAIAFLFFAEELEGASGARRAEIMVVEVGLGGRLDATNVVEPMVSVITDIALDHQEYLGTSLGEITREKAGILRAGGVLVTLSQHEEVNRAIGQAALGLTVRGTDASRYLPPATRNGARPDGGLMQNRYMLRVEDGVEPGEIAVDSPLAGEHQRRNLALAIACAVFLREAPTVCDEPLVCNRIGYDISNEAISEGIRATRWPGRLELLTPDLLIDVAHNPAGAWSLRAALAGLDPQRPRTLIFSCVSDKPLGEMARILFPLFDSTAEPDRRRDAIVLVAMQSMRATPLAELLRAAENLGIPAHAAGDAAEALRVARGLTPEGGLILVTGSIYLVGEMQRLWTQQATELAGL